jgi:hypothetical protein
VKGSTATTGPRGPNDMIKQHRRHIRYTHKESISTQSDLVIPDRGIPDTDHIIKYSSYNSLELEAENLKRRTANTIINVPKVYDVLFDPETNIRYEIMPSQLLDEIWATLTANERLDICGLNFRGTSAASTDDPAVMGPFSDENELNNALFLRLRSTLSKQTRKCYP